MLTPLRVLIVEDSEIDADLIRYHLGKAGFELTWERVETAEEMQAALKSQSWDIIISDYNLPGFSAPAALALLQQSQLEIPFIIDSGTISEETALELMRTGAADYLMKDRLARLGALVRRELNISQIRRERREAQIALDQSQDRLQAIFQASPAIIVQIDRDGTVLWINRTTPKRRREEVIGTSIYQLLPPAEQAKMKSTLDAMMDDHQAAVYESQITRPDGEIIWYENHVSPVIEAGQITSFIYNSIDITQRKRAEISLRESQMVVKEEELYLRTILQTTTEGFWMLDSRGKVLDANQAYCQMSGYSLQELKQFSINDMEAVEDFAATQARINRIQESGSERFETRHHRKNGTIFDVEISVSYLAEYGGRFICFCRDISERKQYEAQLISRMNALTRPLDQLEDFDFKDMFDLKAIQNLQDEFSAATGVASIITYPDGTPITQPSNFCRLCRDIIRKTEKGQINCFKSDAAIGRANLEGPMIQPCMSGGLWDAGAGISVGGRHIANWLIGQVRDQTQQVEDIRAYARQIGADETEAAIAFLEVPPMSQKQFQQVAQVLFTMANQLSTAAYQNVQQARYITERQQVEQELQRWAQIFQHAEWGIVVGSGDGKSMELINPAFAKMHGYSVEEMNGWSIADLFAPECRADLPANIQLAHQKGHYVWESRHIHKNGTTFPVLIDVTAVTNENRQDKYRIVNVQDITQRKQAEEDLRQSEEMFRSISENSFEMIALLDTRGYFHYCNSAYQRILGYSQEDLIGHDGFDLVHPDERAGLYQLFLGALADPLLAQKISTQRILNRIRCVDGSYKLIEHRYRGLRDGQGNIVQILLNAQDVTERKKVEHDLRMSEEKFSTVFRISPDAININRLIDGLYMDVNEGFTALTGYRVEDVFGKTSLEINIWNDPQDRVRLVQGLRASGQVANLEASFRIKDGTIKVCLMSARIIEINGEQCILSITRDITERKQAERVQRLNAERVQALLKLNQMTDSTLQQITQYALEEAVHLTQSKIGYLAFLNEDESVLTMHAWSSQAMQDNEKLDKPLVFKLDDTGPWVEAVRQRQAVMTNDYAAPNSLIKGVPKEHIRIDRHMDVPVLVGNQIVLVAGMGNKDLDYDENDVQQLRLLMEGMWRLIERLKSEEELARHRQHLEDLVAQRTAQLSAANQELEAFSYSVSHDLRAPLRALDGYSEILLSDYAGLLDDQGQNYFRRIQEASHRMGQLINDLLHLSKITRAELSVQQVNLSSLAQKICIELQAQHPDHCPVNWEISAELVVEGDAELLEIALENLLSNAFKFTAQRESAQIAFGQTEHLGKKVFFIRDNGTGFNMENAGKLFAPFQRLHSAKDFPGTGIGLSIVQRVISRHGGRIWPESEVGRGTTFYFTLNRTP